MVSMQKCNLIVALLTLIIGGAIAYTAYGYGIGMSMFGPGAGFWPFILAVSLIVVACLIVFDTFRHQDKYQSQEVIIFNPHNIGVYKMMLAVGLYILLIFGVGFYIASFLFMCGTMKLLGAQRLGLILSVALIFLAVIYLVFGVLLHISLPLPLFME